MGQRGLLTQSRVGLNSAPAAGAYGKASANGRPMSEQSSRHMRPSGQLDLATSEPDTAVPSWVPQLCRHMANLRYFMIITNRDHPEVDTLVNKCLQKLGWKRLELCQLCTEPHDDSDDASYADRGRCAHEPHLWNLLWTWTARRCVSSSKLLMWQRVNHFQECRCDWTSVAWLCARRAPSRCKQKQRTMLTFAACRQLTRKDLLKAHMQRHATMFASSRIATMFKVMPTTFSLPKEFPQFEAAFQDCEQASQAVPTSHIKAVCDECT
jgi:hypothetical protein